MSKTIQRASRLLTLLVFTISSCWPATAQGNLEAMPEDARNAYLQAFDFDLQGDYAKAIPLAERALTLTEKALGPKHPVIAFLLTQLANFNYTAGDYQRAKALLHRAREITEKMDQANPLVLSVINNLGEMYSATGDYVQAEPLLRQGLELAEKTLGADHPEVVTSLNNLAEFYKRMGDYPSAEPLLERALRIGEKTWGAEGPNVATLLNNLAGLCIVTGDYMRAEALYKRALAIRTKRGEHRYIAMVLNNMGSLYDITGHHQLAEFYSRRAYEMSEKVFGVEHPFTILSLSNLGRSYFSLGEYARAESAIRRALEAGERILGPESPDTVTMRSRLAAVYRAMGDYAQAERLNRQAQVLLEKSLGAEHPDIALGLNQLVLILLATGDYSGALASQQRAIEIEEKNINRIFAITSQQQQQGYLNKLAVTPEAAVSLHSYMPKSTDAARLALTVILQRKGRVLDAMSDHIASLRLRSSPEDQQLLDQLSNTLSKLAKLQVSNTRARPNDSQLAEVAQLEAEQIQLEGAISRRSAEFRINSQPVTLDAVSQAVPPDAALVEFFVYYRLNAKGATVEEQFGKPRYIAYVLQRGERVPQWADLGDAADINVLAERLRAALSSPRREDFRRPARDLDERVMRPLRKLLGPTRRLFVSSDSALNLIPFACLVDENGRYLIENYSISYLTSGRDLLRLQIPKESSDTPKVFADPLFDLAATTQRTVGAQISASTMSPTDNWSLNALTSIDYKSLPGTAAEASDLAKLYSDATLLTQAQATEQALKKVNRPRLLHIATHGFFLPEPATPHAPPGGPRVDTPEGSFDRQYFTAPLTTLNKGNPLMRSGLIFAGVKQKSSGPGEDGILTALEVAGLNLWGTKLVVLSACETGLGDLKNGQGVYGLRRALVLAGSETQLMSLWKVSDRGTRDLMASYYARLQRDESRTEALRQVQLEMLRGKLQPSMKADAHKNNKRETSDTISEGTTKDYRHPFYWASFIASGDWRSLTGQIR